MATFIISWGGAIINRLLEWGNYHSSVLTLIQAFCEPFQGTLLAICYGYYTYKDEKVQNESSALLNRLTPNSKTF